MQNLAVTNIIKNFHTFSKLFWLGYKTLEKLHPDFESIKMNLLRSKRIDPKRYENIPNYETEKALLEAEWKLKNEEAKQAGVLTHAYIENLLKNNPIECKTEFLIPTDIYTLSTDITGDGMFIEHKLEFQLNDDYNLIGVPDYFLIKDGYVYIKDWKVSDDPIKFKSMYDFTVHGAKKMKYPISNLEDANGIHYQLLLSIYMWMILQLRPELKCGGLEIVWIKENKIKKIYPVEYLKKDVDKLLKWHVKNLKISEEMKKCQEIEY